MKKLILLFLISTSILPSNAFAYAERQTGVMKGYIPYAWNGKKVLIFNVENNVSGNCNTTARFSVNETNLNYDAIVALLITAYHSKTSVTVQYTETCNMFPNAYDLYAICVGDITC